MNQEIADAITLARTGDTAGMQGWLQAGGDPNRHDRTGWTPLLWAAVRAHAETVTCLLDNGADIALAHGQSGALPIHMAGHSGDVRTTRVLLDRRPEHIDAVWDLNGHTVLLQAVFYGHLDLARFLVERGADTSITTARGLGAIEFAAQFQNQKMMDVIRPYDSPAEAKAAYYQSYLHRIAPFVPDEHFLTFGPGELACSIEAALADQERLDEVADAAYDVLRQRPLASTIEPLVRAADELLRNRPPERLPGRTRTEPLGRHRIAPEPRGSWPSRRVLLRQSLQRSPAATILAPPGTTFRQPLELRRRALFCTCMYDGVDTSGRPTLEGLWPWEPWRLTFGQHLGRVMLVDDRLLDATRRWISEPWAREHETLAVQLFAAVHGLAGDHVPRPLASVTGSPLDPTQSVPEPVASRCRQILGGV